MDVKNTDEEFDFNDKVVKIEVPEAADIIDNKEIVPMIDDDSNVKQVDKVMNNV